MSYVELVLKLGSLSEQNAKHDEAWMILKRVHDTNWRAKGQPEKVFTVSTHFGLEPFVFINRGLNMDRIGYAKYKKSQLDF